MPFFRRSRRFSATPRRSWRRSRQSGTGTRETRRQYAQANMFTQLTIDNGALVNDPSFTIDALTPWANGPGGGFDRAWDIKGLVWNLQGFCIFHTIAEADTEQLYDSTNIVEAFSRMANVFFVDQVDSIGAPVSILNVFHGPFITTPPIASPAAAPADDEFMPTRVLKRKSGLIQTGFAPDVSTGQSAYHIGLSNFRWSGAIRKRISIASRQGLFFGSYGLPPGGGFPNTISSATILITGEIFFYYSLRR